MLAQDHVMCMNCEGIVPKTATACPFCFAAQEHEQPTPLRLHNTKPSSESSSLCLIVSLFLFMVSSAFLALATIIALFSSEGCLTIAWTENMWTKFFGLGIALAAIGSLFFQQTHD